MLDTSINKLTTQFASAEMSGNGIIPHLSNTEDYGTVSPESLRILAERIETDMKREEITKQHNHRVWQEKSGRRNTYIDDPEAKRGFRKVSRKTRGEILDILLDYWEDEQ